MLLHDVKNFEKEQDMRKAMYRDNQRQLKAYLDKQVNDIKNKQKVEIQKEQNEHSNLVKKINTFDQAVAKRQESITKRMMENKEYLTQALQQKMQSTSRDFENKQNERMYLLKQIKEITDKEHLKSTKKQGSMLDTNEYLKSVIIQKSKEKDLAKQAQLREEKQTMQDQISHFDKMAKRYRDIFTIIGEKEQKIQNSYMQLKPGHQNLALAETERDKSIEEIVTKQKLEKQVEREQYEAQLRK